MTQVQEDETAVRTLRVHTICYKINGQGEREVKKTVKLFANKHFPRQAGKLVGWGDKTNSPWKEFTGPKLF